VNRKNPVIVGKGTTRTGCGLEGGEMRIKNRNACENKQASMCDEFRMQCKMNIHLIGDAANLNV